ncbi:MAG: DUF2339 domain-containing protein [Helicobacteraceae bacterium]|jgi:uncharacterized membrane protein|nr:DUF2339 domain-containing protein [Helicobacteraceae bacterium]
MELLLIFVVGAIAFVKISELKQYNRWLSKRIDDLRDRFNAELSDLKAQIANLAPREEKPQEQNAAEFNAQNAEAAAPNQAQTAPQTQTPQETPFATRQSPQEAVIAAKEAPKPPSKSAPLSNSAIALDRFRQIKQSPKPAPIANGDKANESGLSDFDRLFNLVKNWALGDNAILRVGAVLLFIGLAFLLRYASDRLPIEARYAGATIGAFAIFAIGWRLRSKKPSYALTLQGAAVGMLYLISFAAMRIHHLIPREAAFVLLAILVVFAAILALRQNSAVLACAATAGGFAAPILTSSGSNDYVALFSYFALLNAGVLAIARFKAWRVLNVIGFIGTFGIGFAWGVRSFVPEMFASVQPFLALFFVMYVAIGLLFARSKLLAAQNAPNDRGAALCWSAQKADYVDGFIVFAPPLVGFGFQCAIVARIEYGMAFSALAIAAFYALIAFALSKNPRMALLAEIAAALSAVFATLSVPLALDSQWTSAAWAVEGAGMYWLGFKQSRRMARSFATALIFCSAIAFSFGDCGVLTEQNLFAFYMQTIHPSVPAPLWNEAVLDGSPLGAIMLGAATLFCFWTRRKFSHFPLDDWERQMPLVGRANAALNGWERNIAPVFAAVGLWFVYLAAPLTFSLNYTQLSWAIAAAVTIAVGLRSQSKTFLACAFALSALGGAVYFAHRFDEIISVALSGAVDSFGAVGEAIDGVKPIINFGFLIAFAIAASGFISARLLQKEADKGAIAARYQSTIAIAANAALVWSAAWLALAIFCEAARLARFADFAADLAPIWSRRAALLTFAGLTPIFAFYAEFRRWQSLAIACLLLLATAILIFAADGVWLFESAKAIADGESFALFGVMAIAPIALFAAHFTILWRLERLLSAALLNAAHAIGAVLLIAVLSFNMRDLFLYIFGDDNAWIWLSMAIFPSLYMLFSSVKRVNFYPINAFSKAYRLYAAAPIATALIIWFWSANFASSGKCEPLIFLPLINPLEISLILVLLATLRWALTLRANFANFSDFDDEAIKQSAAIVSGVSLLALCTLAVCRVAHHFGDMSFDFGDMFNSMGVQASWSIVWTLFAFALMIGGNRAAKRSAWIAGATLIAIVVVKLFLIELSDQSGLARMISFIGVGATLLIIGYFSPLPPRAQNENKPLNKSG